MARQASRKLAQAECKQFGVTAEERPAAASRIPDIRFARGQLHLLWMETACYLVTNNSLKLFTREKILAETKPHWLGKV